MKIDSLCLYHLELPCKNSFEHAQSVRQTSEVILLKANWNDGVVSWGEMIPREYVTGESISSILAMDHKAVFELLLSRDFKSISDVESLLEPYLQQGRSVLSYVGGLEIMLLDALAQRGRLDLNKCLGPVRSTPVGRCVTIGMDCSESQIRGRFIDAKLKNATAIKLKVGADTERDARCLSELMALNQGRLNLRLDGNAAASFDDVCLLLSECDTTSIHSFEEPLAFNTPELTEKLFELNGRFDIDMMADESVCSVFDAEHIIRSGHYQCFNIRVGKHGGLLASARIRDLALDAGIGIVGGSMVGETGVLTQASSVFLHRSSELNYVEGLGQNQTWLVDDPVENKGCSPAEFSRLDARKHVFDNCVRESFTYHA